MGRHADDGSNENLNFATASANSTLNSGHLTKNAQEKQRHENKIFVLLKEFVRSSAQSADLDFFVRRQFPS